MPRKPRLCFSYAEELLKKSQEAALSAVSIFNNPNIQFKSESFIVLMVIAWTYLLHAYYRKNNVDYRYYTTKGQSKRKFYDRTKRGAYKYWELERCLNERKCPVDKAAKDNLLFLIGIRHEIEHQMTTQIDNLISAKFQACSMNYNQTIVKLFGKKYCLGEKLQMAIQFFGFSEEQNRQLVGFKDVPQNIIDFIAEFEKNLSDEEIANPKFSYKVIYVRENANRSGQADIAYRFIDEKSATGKEIQNVLVKPGKEAAKYKPKQIVELMKKKGYKDFNIHKHTLIWKEAKAKNPRLNYGIELEDGQWYWYYSWFLRVEQEYKKILEAKSNEESTHE